MEATKKSFSSKFSNFLKLFVIRIDQIIGKSNKGFDHHTTETLKVSMNYMEQNRNISALKDDKLKFILLVTV